MGEAAGHGAKATRKKIIASASLSGSMGPVSRSRRIRPPLISQAPCLLGTVDHGQMIECSITNEEVHPMKSSLVRDSGFFGAKLLRTLIKTSWLLLLPLWGCVTAGKDFNSETAWLKEGHTKQEDVRMVLGDPRSVGNALGKPTWTYGYYRYNLIGESDSKELKLYWNPNGTLSHYSFNSSFAEDKGHPQPAKKKDVPKDDTF